MAEGSPTIRRRELASALRRLRLDKGLTAARVAELLMCSASKVSRMETAQRPVTLRDVRGLCEIYGVSDEAERDRLMTLARQAKEQGWWQSFDLPYSTYIGLEAEAVAVKDFDSAVVPGLLQTVGYARALYDAPLPEPSIPVLTPELIDQQVAARLSRQDLLSKAGDRSELRLHAVMDEAVVHRVIGSPAVMNDQLTGLIEMSREPNVTIQIVPYIAGAHPSLDSTFNVLEFADGAPSVVSVEGPVGKIYVERPDEVGRYLKVFDWLSDRAVSRSIGRADCRYAEQLCRSVNCRSRRSSEEFTLDDGDMAADLQCLV